MKANKFLGKTFLVLLSGAAIVSCSDSEIPLEVFADVMVINKKVDNAVKRAPAYYAYGNQSIQSASVALPSTSEIVELGAYPGSSYTFYRQPEAADYEDVPPADGNYEFTVKAQTGEIMEVTDVFDFEGLTIPQIKKDTFVGSPVVLNVEWAAVTGSDGYFVKLLDTDEKLVFSGYIVSSSTLKYTVSSSASSGSWVKSPVEGEDFILQVNAIAYDTGSTSATSDYNVSEISIGEKPIIWGVNIPQ
jgi:hypothetical protein